PPEPTRVRIEIASVRPTEVSLDLRPYSGERPLVVHSLRAVDADKPRLTDVSFRAAAADDPASLRIAVPDDQPAGIYNGLIVDEETGRPLGTLSVRVIAK